MESHKIWTLIKQNFPGRNNSAIRERIFEAALDGRDPRLLKNTIALTAQGLAGLDVVANACDLTTPPASEPA